MKSHKCPLPLPEELLLHEILPRLPTKSILRFKCVSKTWLSLISQHSFLAAKHAGEKPGIIILGLHSNRNRIYTISSLFSLNDSEIDTSYIYKKNPASIVMVGSCNGVVCLKLVYSDKSHDLVMWNPATREVNYLPAAAATDECKSFYSGYALGFDAHTAVHKVVWLKKSSRTVTRSVTARIFSKKNMRRRWRYLKPLTPIRANTIFLGEGDGLTIDGAIYWIAHPFNVLSFDLSKEELRELDGPLSRLDHRIDDGFYFNVINWKGSMGAVFVKPGGTEIHLWLKNKDTNNSDSGWKKISTIQPFLGPLRSGRVFTGRQIVLICDDSGPRKEILYDLVTKENIEFKGRLKNMPWLQICEHFDTVISPN